ncbi:MAG: formylglycine-generating enzyme family protein, partial [Planctomycetia bacterium]|nr:formylglycine-generating enzyme family protein [Planctomycetia bacterium]
MRAAAVVGMVLLCGIAQGAQPKTVTNTIGMVLIDIPAGKFTMGEGAVAVTLTKPFWLGKTEVPQGQWQAVMGTEPWKGYEEIKIGKDFAASYVDWNDATAFCQKLTDLERKAGKLKANEEYRLPTEAEWEYACRAGTTTAYSFGDDKKQLGNYGWFQGNALRIGENYAHPVSRKQPNPWGLYDMHGNVYEW